MDATQRDELSSYCKRAWCQPQAPGFQRPQSCSLNSTLSSRSRPAGKKNNNSDWLKEMKHASEVGYRLWGSGLLELRAHPTTEDNDQHLTFPKHLAAVGDPSAGAPKTQVKLSPKSAIIVSASFAACTSRGPVRRLIHTASGNRPLRDRRQTAWALDRVRVQATIVLQTPCNRLTAFCIVCSRLLQLSLRRSTPCFAKIASLPISQCRILSPAHELQWQF